MESKSEQSSHLPENAPLPGPEDPASGWSAPQPEKLPRPTFAPAGIAFGATLLLWGLLTSYLVSIVGLLVFAASLFLWIREILHERS